ncbi:MAG: nqrE [Chlamydiales bacterium]|jgi:Na+-transporting NADH:ubiquinone oxidoreductase subunit E|nr:nqrE [Chlamydiales bacterium]
MEWMGPYTPLNLLGLLIQSVFVDNVLLVNFLGMCTFLACSNKLKTANGLGIAVIGVMIIAGSLNWVANQYLLVPGALKWLNVFGIDASNIDLSFLQFIMFISIIAGFVQVLEIVMEKFTPALYNALGIFLPLITVNCAILGGCLIATPREYPFIPHVVYMTGSGIGWWLAIVLMAAIREKLSYSHVVPGLKGMGITFVAAGLMAMAFMGLGGIQLSAPTGQKAAAQTEQAKATAALANSSKSFTR